MFVTIQSSNDKVSMRFKLKVCPFQCRSILSANVQFMRFTGSFMLLALSCFLSRAWNGQAKAWGGQRYEHLILMRSVRPVPSLLQQSFQTEDRHGAGPKTASVSIG